MADYPRLLYKADGDRRNRCLVHSDDEKAEKLANGWRLTRAPEAPAPEAAQSEAVDPSDVLIGDEGKKRRKVKTH